MRGLAVGILGALVLAAAATGLAVGWLRDGPHDVAVNPAVLGAGATGTFERQVDGLVLGACPTPPCAERAAIDLRFTGLPDLPFGARLLGPGSAEDLGPLRREGDAHVLRWESEGDHSGKRRLALEVAGRAVAEHPVAWTPGPGTMAADWELLLQWGAEPGTVHLNEIGGVTVSTVALAELGEAPPPGLEFRAYLEGPGGRVDLGAFAAKDGGAGAALDGRVERVRLADHGRVVVTVAREGAAAWDGLPILEGAF